MNPKIIVCDLDGTLAPSKSPVEKSIADVISRVLEKHRMAVISGGALEQFQKQFISHLTCEPRLLSRLYLFPTNGSSCYTYDESGQIREVYNERMTDEERAAIIAAFHTAIAESGVDVSAPFGELIEDRGGQVTFSGRGQQAPLEVKEVWDPDKTKRQQIVALLEPLIPQFEIRIGGATSIDVTHRGITKAYGIEKIEKMLHEVKEDIVYIGDALFPGGNDASARETGVECISVSGPRETEQVLINLL